MRVPNGIAAKNGKRMAKENIDTINIKCHDLKHQIRALRENDSSVSFSLTINGVPVTFTQSGDPTVTTVETDKITLNSEADLMFGQRLCIVPDPDSTVSVSGLTLPGEQTA